MFQTKRSRQQERRKLAAGCLGTAALLAFVFLMAADPLSLAGKRDSHAALQQFDGPQATLLAETGRTEWQYQDSGEPAADDWMQPQYDASGWKTGSGSFGSMEGKLEPQVSGQAPRNLLNHFLPDGRVVPVYYFRTEFLVSDIGGLQSLSGTLLYDDAALVYLNGTLVYAVNVPDNGYAPEDNGYGAKRSITQAGEESFTITDLSALREGRNVLAVELHQSHSQSSDIYFDLTELKASRTPVQQTAPTLSGLVLEPGTTESSVHVNWLAEQKSAFALLWREEGGSNEWNTALMSRYPVSKHSTRIYQADLSGLEPGKRYTYKLRDIAAGLESETHTVTAGSPERFSFAYAGDVQIGAGDLYEDGKAWERALDRLRNAEPAVSFLITAGDQADSSKEENAYEEFLQFRRPEVLRELPTAVNNGNHESQKNGAYQQFERFTAKKSQDYWFTYGDTLFYALNTENDNYAQHLEGLRSAIEEVSPRWTIVTMHYTLFGAKDRSDESSVMDARSAYAAEFSALDVDLVLAGHDHYYSRSFLMAGEVSTGRESGAKAAGETLYFSGGSPTGSKFSKIKGSPAPYIAFAYTERKPTITCISVDAERLLIETFRIADWKLVDQCVLQK